MNFAPSNWLRHGAASLKLYHRPDAHRQSVFSYHNLVCTAARSACTGDATEAVIAALRAELARLRTVHVAEQAALTAAGIVSTARFPKYAEADQQAEEDAIQCAVCLKDCFLLACVCPCSQRVTCAQHHAVLCACPPSSKRQLVRYSASRLARLEARLADARASTTPADVAADVEALDKWRRQRLDERLLTGVITAEKKSFRRYNKRKR